MGNPISVPPALPLSVATTPPRALPPLPPPPASGRISSLPSPSSVPMPAPAMRTSSPPLPARPSPPSRSAAMPMSSSSTAAATAAAAATAHREAIREGERRKRAQTEGDDMLSAGKRKVSAVKQAKAQTAKRFKSPTVPVSPLYQQGQLGSGCCYPQGSCPHQQNCQALHKNPQYLLLSVKEVVISGMDLHIGANLPHIYGKNLSQYMKMVW